MPPTKKLCMVCGDKALGYNFNAVTCESCKAFFRRNALSNKNFVCPFAFSENCEVTVITRRFCQRCRLEKCFKIGMRKEHIMSEEDKMMKKKKIEQNRAKRKLLLMNKDKDSVSSSKQQKSKIKREISSSGSGTDFGDGDGTEGKTQMKERDISNDNDDIDVNHITTVSNNIRDNDINYNHNNHHELWSADKIKRNYSDSSSCGGRESPCDFSNTSISCESYKIDHHDNTVRCQSMNNHQINNNNNVTMRDCYYSHKEPCPYTVCYTSNVKDIVNSIVNKPETATQILNHIMRTPKETVDIVTKIINSPTEAMRFISHLILHPGDALKIISKIMNSPLDALTVFTKFMSSPTDALQIISRVVNSPADVLQFIQQLMQSPEDAINIMEKFMNTPAEALKIINHMVNNNNCNGSNTEMMNININDKKIVDENRIEIDDDSATATATISTSIQQKPVTVDTITTTTGKKIKKSITSTITKKPTGNICNGNNPIPINYDAVNNSMIDSMLNEVQSPVSSVPSSPGGATVVTANMKYVPVTTISSTLTSPSQSLPASTTSIITGGISLSSSLSNNNYVDIRSSTTTPFLPSSLSSQPPPASIITNTDSTKFNYIDIGELTFNILNAKSNQMKNILEDVEDRPIQPNSIESVLCEAIKLEYETYNTLPQTIGDSKELNEAEKAKLNELIQASKALYYPVDEDLSSLINDDRIKCEGNQNDPKLLHLINLTAVAIRRLIKMSKKINAFRNMCQEDQVALLKGGCTEMMIMRSVMTYDQNKAIWKIPHSKEDMSNIKVDVLKLAKGNVYDEHERFIRTFEPKWRMDENIILIMCAILLFSPSRPRIIHSDVIKLEQNSYYYLLRRYLESVFPGCEAKSTFIKLIQKISEVAKLNEVIISVYLNVNPSHIEPLLREIFDMKNH